MDSSQSSVTGLSLWLWFLGFTSGQWFLVRLSGCSKYGDLLDKALTLQEHIKLNQTSCPCHILKFPLGNKKLRHLHLTSEYLGSIPALALGSSVLLLQILRDRKEIVSEGLHKDYDSLGVSPLSLWPPGLGDHKFEFFWSVLWFGLNNQKWYWAGSLRPSAIPVLTGDAWLWVALHGPRG